MNSPQTESYNALLFPASRDGQAAFSTNWTNHKSDSDEAGVRSGQLQEVQDFRTQPSRSITMDDLEPQRSLVAGSISHLDGESTNFFQAVEVQNENASAELVFPVQNARQNELEMQQIREQLEKLQQDNQELREKCDKLLLSQEKSAAGLTSDSAADGRGMSIEQSTALQVGDISTALEERLQSGSHKPVKGAPSDKEIQLRDWGTTVSENAFGAFIHVTMTEGTVAALQKVSMWVIFSWGLQVTTRPAAALYPEPALGIA